MNGNNTFDLPDMVDKIQGSRKYRSFGIPDETIADILRQELARHAKPADAVSSAKAILHNVMAPYLGDIDHDQAQVLLDEAISSDSPDALKQVSRKILEQHDSTRERLTYIEDFYRLIRSVCPNLHSILDLACGLNPFAFPFMGMPADVRYHAYDIHKPRIELINHFFERLGLEPLAEVRDVLVDPPEVKADAAFLFKEAHRMEKRRKGASRDLIKAINTKFIFVSLPNRSLDKRRNLSARMNRLIQEIFEDETSEICSAEFAGETLYWYKRENG